MGCRRSRLSGRTLGGMARLHAVSFFLLVSVVVGCAQQGTVIISDPEARVLPDDTPWQRVLSVAPGWPVTFDFEKTSKGNGGLTFPGGFARVYDAHDDGVVFAPPTLHTRLVDLDRDGYADVELSGTAVFYDDKGDLELDRHPVRATFMFVPSERRFVASRSDPSIYAEVR